MSADPYNITLQAEERFARTGLDSLSLAEESMHKQRSRDLAVNLGDGNSKYFYRLLRARHAHSFISQITDAEGNTFSEPQGIAAVLVSYFSNLLGPTVDMHQPDLSYISPSNYVSDEDAESLKLPVAVSEIEEVIKASNPNKAPGPDGFNAHFFKVFWPIIGNDVCEAITDFFKHGQMLNRSKASFIVLVPKSEYATSPDKFRPISLTNELYKIISRILVHRLKPIIGKLLSPMQSSFIPGRSIADNILVAQDLIHNFHLSRGTPRMCVKIDLAKAYDSVVLEFLEAALRCLRFPVLGIHFPLRGESGKFGHGN